MRTTCALARSSRTSDAHTRTKASRGVRADSALAHAHARSATNFRRRRGTVGVDGSEARPFSPARAEAHTETRCARRCCPRLVSVCASSRRRAQVHDPRWGRRLFYDPPRASGLNFEIVLFSLLGLSWSLKSFTCQRVGVLSLSEKNIRIFSCGDIDQKSLFFGLLLGAHRCVVA